jgi:hypothetical protein
VREATTINPQRERNGNQKAGSSTRRTRFVLNDTRFRDIGNVQGARLTFELAPERCNQHAGLHVDDRTAIAIG